MDSSLLVFYHISPMVKPCGKGRWDQECGLLCRKSNLGQIVFVMVNKAVGLDSLFTIKIGQAMTSRIRKAHQSFTSAQKLEYAKLMVEENYPNQQVMALSDAGSTAVSRWKHQFLAEQRGEVI